MSLGNLLVQDVLQNSSKVESDTEARKTFKFPLKSYSQESMFCLNRFERRTKIEYFVEEVSQGTWKKATKY